MFARFRALYTYGPYFDALRDECRRKARETLEARERAKEYAVISLLKERPKMNEEVLNTSLRSPTFDHCVVTGGEAARFLMALK